MPPFSDPTALSKRVRIIVCVGTGGVGKTTVAAAVGLQGARQGERTLVLTIDPARRLADALSIGELGDNPRELSEAMRQRLGIRGRGQFSAMMLDMKRTFDDLVTRFADDPETRERILANPIYQHVSDALAGSAEYAAMEKVFELAQSDRFDLIVLDTPPSQHALDFLEAPERLISLLDSRIVKLLVHPAFSAGRLGFRIFRGATRRALELIENLSGVAFLEDLSEFLLAFEGMAGGFRERAHLVQSMLLGPESGFVLIAGPSPEAAHNATQFLAHLEDSGAPMSGVIVNRMRLWPSDEEPPGALGKAMRGDEYAQERHELARALADRADAADDPHAAEAAAKAALAAAAQYASLVRLDEHSTRALRKRAAQLGLFYRVIPELARDIHDLDGLQWIAAQLFGDQGTDAEPVDGRTSAEDSNGGAQDESISIGTTERKM